ncbi:hypothetical protein D9M68_766730 [compost metagenome]
MRLGGIESCFDAGPVGNVEGDRQRLAALKLDVLGNLFEPLDASCGEYHTGAGAAGEPCQVRTDAAGSASHQHGAAGQGKLFSEILAHQNTSNRPAAPMPPPTHMVTTTYFTPRRLPSSRAWPTMRAPLMP